MNMSSNENYRAIAQGDGHIRCGSDTAKRHFAFGRGYSNLNHGSYGACPAEIRAVYRHYQDRIDARPDDFTRYEYRPHLLDESRKVLSKYLEVPLDTCVLVPNASTAFDTIVRNMQFSPGDVIVSFDIGYGSFANTLRYLAEMTPLEYVAISCDVTVSDDHLCDALNTKIEELRADGKTVRMAVFDAISSTPGVRLPFERLTKLCRDHGVLSCIDGAHAVGQINVDLATLDPDFFLSNLHKWLYVPRPCAVLYVPKRNQRMLRSTLPTGFDWLPRSSSTPMQGKAFAANFQSVGTLDDTPYLCINGALIWRQRFRWHDKCGEDAIKGHTHWLAAEGGTKTAEVLGTDIMDNEEGTLTRCAMTNVRLPLPGDDPAGSMIMKRMMTEHDTAVMVYCYGGQWWVRLSAQVYLTVEDFERTAMLLRQMCEEVVRSG